MSRVIQMRAFILLVGGLFAALAFAKPVTDLDPTSRSEISERIAPVGKVCQTGEECATSAGVAAAASGPRAGDAIYSQFCVACHGTGLLGASKKGDLADWEKRQKAAGGFSKLLGNAISGIRSMPPKGTCMDCSDEEISSAIQYMSGLKP